MRYEKKLRKMRKLNVLFLLSRSLRGAGCAQVNSFSWGGIQMILKLNSFKKIKKKVFLH